MSAACETDAAEPDVVDATETGRPPAPWGDGDADRWAGSTCDWAKAPGRP